MEDVLIRLRMVPKYPGTMLCKDAADEIERLRAELAACRAALELIAAPQRSDGSWNRDREACRQVAQAALAAGGE